MRKKPGLTFIEQAIVLVPEFEKVVRKLPEKIDPEEINEYLAALARDPLSPSRSSFKHMVYGLRYYYRLLVTFQYGHVYHIISTSHKIGGITGIRNIYFM